MARPVMAKKPAPACSPDDQSVRPGKSGASFVTAAKSRRAMNAVVWRRWAPPAQGAQGEGAGEADNFIERARSQFRGKPAQAKGQSGHHETNQRKEQASPDLAGSSA